MKALFALALVLLAPVFASAEARKMSAEDALAAAASGEIVLIDIRQPEEWAQSGMAAGAVPLPMRDRQIGAKLGAILERAGDRPLAFICATGKRSAYLTEQLVRAGVPNVIDISEGMFGSAAGPGWLKRGQPVEKPGATFEDRLESLAAE